MPEQLGPWHESYTPPTGPVVFVIMDGVGLAPPNDGNAVSRADIPTCAGSGVSTPRCSSRRTARPSACPRTRTWATPRWGTPSWAPAGCCRRGPRWCRRRSRTARCSRARPGGPWWTRCTGEGAGTLHLIGLLSDGNVHSHIDHLLALLHRADADGVARVRVHPLLDGRDVEPFSAPRYLDQLEAVLAELSAKPDRDYRIASGGGRMRTTMDRYWERPEVVQAGWKAHVLGQGRPVASAGEAVQTAYDEGVESDQDIPAFVVVDDAGKPVGTIEDGDAVLLFNFRGDRAIELSSAFEYDDFDFFDRGRRPDVLFVGMLQYDGDLQLPKHCLLVPPPDRRYPHRAVERRGRASFHVAESSKFGHVTYYLFGMRSQPFRWRRCGRWTPRGSSRASIRRCRPPRWRTRSSRPSAPATIGSSSSTSPTATWWAIPVGWMRPWKRWRRWTRPPRGSARR
jgi:2,3-bisphosphoglycerate-independent phosphoglycerate mutase